MKVRILRRWLCGGCLVEPGALLELPEALAKSGIRNGLCSKVKQRKTGKSEKGRAELV